MADFEKTNGAQSANQESDSKGFKPLEQILADEQAKSAADEQKLGKEQSVWSQPQVEAKNKTGFHRRAVLDIGGSLVQLPGNTIKTPRGLEAEKEAELRNKILESKALNLYRYDQKFQRDKAVKIDKANKQKLLGNPALVEALDQGRYTIQPEDLVTGKALSIQDMQSLQQNLSQGGAKAMETWLALQKPRTEAEINEKLETRKKENVAKLKNSISDNDFLKHTNLRLYQQQIDRDNEEQSLSSENSMANSPLTGLPGMVHNALGDLFDNRMKPVVDKKGRINPELKAQALVGGLDNPYSVYYKKGAEQRVNPNSLAVVTDGLVADKIEQHSKTKSEWQQISDAVQTGARYGLGNVSKYTSSPLAEYTSAVVRGAMTTASFVDAALNGTVFSGTGFNSNAFFDALERNQKVIDKFAPASPEFKDKNILDEAAIMLGEFQAGGEVAKVLPFAGNLTRARNAKLAGLLSSEAKPMNALTSLYLRGYSSTPVKYATKYLDNFVGMNIAGTPVVYTNAYIANRRQGDSREEASKKAAIESQVLAGTMSIFGTFLHREPHGDVAKTMLGKPEVKNWVGKRVEKVNQAFNNVGMPAPVKIAQKTAMGSLEFSMFDSYMEYRRQKEEHDKLIENGQIPKNTAFKMNPEKLLIAAKHGAMMGGVVGAIGAIRDGNTDFLQGDAVALSIKDPDQFKLSIQRGLDNGYLTAESAKQLISFVAVVKPKYLALEGATIPVFKNGKQVGSVKMDDNTRVALAVRQARMAEIQNNLDLYKNKSEQYSERKIIDLEIQAANEQRDINKLETGTVVKGQLFTPKDIAKMAKDYTERGMLEKQRAELKANGAYKAETIDLEQFKTDEDVKAYLAVKENSEAAQEFKTQLDEIETKLAKISAAEKLGKKLSLREQSEKESLMDERAKLKADNALFAKHLDILDFSDPHNLAPVIGKDGNIIDGKKRIAAAIAKGDKNIEVLRPLTEAEHAEMLNEREEDVFGANEPNYEGLDVEDAARLRAARAAYDNAGGRAAGVAAAKESLRKGEKLYETEEPTQTKPASEAEVDIEGKRKEALNALVRYPLDSENSNKDRVNAPDGFGQILKTDLDKINTEHDGLYLKAVEDGKMSREEAMQALEKAGRKDSEAYRQIEATEPTQTTEEPTQTKPEEPITEEKLTDLLSRVSPEVVNPVLAEAAAKMDMPVPEVKPVQTFKPNKILKGINDTIHKIATKLRGSRPAPRLVLSVSVDDAKRIADAYEEMKHDPNNPEVKRGFEELVTEIKKQADALLAEGYTFELTTKGEGYGSNSEKTFKDVKENKRILVESSEESFGTDRKFDKDNIGLMDSGYKDVNGRPLTNVELIRGVHDLFGHSEYGNGFGAIGEENAWRIHMSMFSPLAQKALTATTRGQNSWVNFGKHMRNADGSIKKKGDEGYMDAASRPFAEQKIGFLPDWATDNAYGDVVELNGKEVKPVNKFVVDGKAMYDIDDPVAFRDALIAAKENRKANGKNDWIQVHAKTEKEYEELLKQGGHLLVSKDGKVGIAVGADGFVGSGFAHVDAPKGALAPLLNMAIKLGARYTDAFDTYLPEYYAKFGFKASGRMKFDEAMAEEGWSDTILKDKPDVVFMYYDGGDRMTIDKRFGEFEEYSKTDGEYVSSYDEGVAQSKLVSDNIEPEASLLPVEPETKPVSETEAVSPKAKEIAGKLTERIKAGKQQTGDLKNIDADQYSEEREEAKTEYEAQLENELEELREAYADVTRSEAELRKIQNNKSKSLSKFVDRLINGTTEQDVIDAKAKLADAKKKYREAKAALTAQLPRERGSNYIIERLSRAARQGEISQEAADLAIDLVRANPELFEDLAISITKAPQGSDALGFYRAAEALVKVFKGGTDDLTATHELLHHTERFLPLEIRDKILEEWSTQIDKQIADLKSKLAKEKNPDTRNDLINKLLYLGIAKERQVEPNAQNRKDMERIMAKYMRGYVDSKGRMQKGIGKDWYQYSNPSEWWAVNASKLYAEAKNKPQLRTWLDKAKAFYDQLIASAKRVFKGSRTAAVEKGLKAIFNGETLSSREGEVLAQTKGLSTKGEVLFQLVGENAELAQDVRDNLQVARNMEAAGKDAKTIRIATGWEKGKDGKWRYEILDGHLKGEVRTFKGNLSDIIESKELFNAYPQLAKLEVDLDLNGFDKGAYYARRSKIEVNGSRETVLPILLHEIQHAIQEIEGFAKGGNPSQMTTPNDVLQELASPLSFPKLSKEDRLIAKQKTREQGLRFGETFYFDVITDDIYELHDLVERLEILNSVSPNEAYVKLIDALDYKIMEMRGENVAFDKYKKLVGEVEARNVQNRMGMTPEQRRETLLSETEDVARDEQIVLFDSNGIQMQVDAEQSDLQTIKDFIEEQRKEGVSEEDIKEGVRLAAKELGIKDVDSLFSEKDSTFDPKAEYEASFEGKASSRAIREAKMPFIDKYFKSIVEQLEKAKKIKRIC